MSDTTRLGLPRIDAAQAQKHVTHNEALGALDALVQLSAKTRNAVSPLADAAEGDRAIVGAQPTGAFVGRAGQIASFEDGGWFFYKPRKGWRCYVESENRLLVFDGAAWVPLQTDVVDAQNVRYLGLAATADANNPLNLRLNNALFNAVRADEGGSGDLRVKFNKAQTANVLSHLYQTGWSGRAEAGLLGDDRYRLKVSADGGAWKEAFNVDPASGRVFFPNGASDQAAVAAITGGTPAAYTLQGAPTGPLADGALVWMVPHAPNATALDADPTLQIYGADAAPLRLKNADGSTLPQGALEPGRALLLRKTGQAYCVQNAREPLTLLNVLEDGGRFAGAPDATTAAVGAFVDPTYFINVNGASRAAYGVARAGAAPPILDLLTKIRAAAALAAGPEFHVLQVTVGGGSSLNVTVQSRGYAPFVAAQRRVGKAQTGALYFRVLTGGVVVAPVETCPRALIDGVAHDTTVDAQERVFGAAQGWRHLQFWISGGGDAPFFWPLRGSPGATLLIALPAIVPGFQTLPWDIGALPTPRLWR